MREIKFRAKAMSKKIVGWHYGLVRSIANDGTGFLQDQHRNCVHINTYTLGQYTGLKDKNDKEIYEGDIVECIRDRDTLWGELVVIEDIRDLPRALYGSNLVSKEVVGNIYENQDILL